MALTDNALGLCPDRICYTENAAAFGDQVLAKQGVAPAIRAIFTKRRQRLPCWVTVTGLLIRGGYLTTLTSLGDPKIDGTG